MDHVPGTIYLLHFDRPYKHARHWAQDLNSRLAEHRRGTGAPLLQVVRDGAVPGTATGAANASSMSKAAGPACARPASTPSLERLP